MAAKVTFICLVLFVATAIAQDCGKLQGANIEDKNNKLPWLVQVRERMTNDVLCSGTLISPSHVLVSAHCLWPKPYFKALKVISNIFITIGDEKFDLMDVKIHSDWKFNKDTYDADVAIVSLFRPVTLSNTVQPICLPPRESNAIIVPGGVVAGMGVTDKSSVRQRVAVEKNDDCFKNFPKDKQSPSPRTFCANWPGEDLELTQDFSGGYFYSKDDVWYLQGIESNSFAQKNQCDIKKHSVFSNVASYVDWIQKIVKRDTERQWKDIELKCTYVKNYEGLYGCEVEGLTINSPNVRVAGVSGQHTDRNSNAEVEYVWIRNSRVSRLPRFDAGLFFPNLIKYLVTSTGLQFIERDDFSGMPKLETLDVSGNEIEEVPEDTLFDLSELVDFFIDNNKVKVFPENLLNNSHNFQRFKASNNSLEVLEANFFKNNPSLKILSLDNNKLHKIKVDFRPFKNLKKIDLLNNSCVNTNYNDWRKFKSIPIIQKEIEASCL